MRYILCINLFLLVSLMSCATHTTTQNSFKTTTEPSTWDRYIDTELNTIMEEESEFNEFSEGPQTKPGGLQMNFNSTADQEPYKFVVFYQDEVRPITEEKQLFLDYWGKAVQIDNYFLGLFNHEMLFKNGSSEYWFPVQSVLIPYFQQELTNGDMVELYTMFIGTYKKGDDIDWVFIVNEFQSMSLR